ncbi:hypothetical protein ACFSUS_22580 [Spirosoma soli]|uniref:Uncharacterized protein n=1 Tax=Spirosoma soli TaxID=1770529 RepID=A0ABW5M9V4_9BACT
MRINKWALLLRYKELERERLAREAEAETFADGGPAKPKKPLPVSPVVAASSTATTTPANLFQMRRDNLASIQQQTAANQPQLKPTGYVPQAVKQGYVKKQAWEEFEDKALNIADKAAYAMPIPVVGEVIGGISAGVMAGIKGARTLQDIKQGDYGSAALNLGGVAFATAGGLAAKPLTTMRKIAFRPTYANNVAQAEADAGGEWARSWFKGRAEASMGGLTPSDAIKSQAIKRPVVTDSKTWRNLLLSERIDGVYSPIGNFAVISPNTTYPKSTAVHEATHQFQNAMKSNSAMREGLATIKREIPVRDGRMTSYDRYWTKPVEVHSRLMELRHALGYKPNEFITSERFAKDVTDYMGKSTSWDNPVAGFDNFMWQKQAVNWLNNVPSVALPVAAGSVATGAYYNANKRQ